MTTSNNTEKSPQLIETYDPEAVANYFIEKGIESGDPVNHMKLQKLIYIAHGWCLAFFDRPLINEPPEAWQYGPVIKSLYGKLKHNGTAPIKKLLDGGQTVSEPHTSTMLDAIWSVYGQKTAIQLSSMTHREGTPWTETPHNSYISDAVIQAYYKNLRNGDGLESACA